MVVAAAPGNSSVLLEELEEHNDFFDMIVDMIPSKLYIAGQSGDDFFDPNSSSSKRYYKYPASMGDEEDEDGEGKPLTKEARRAANKAQKRRKLDPKQAETTVQIKQRLNGSTQKQSSGKPLPMTKPGEATTATATDASGTEADADEAIVVSPHQSRIEALRAKLHAKLAAKRPHSKNSSPDQVSKRAARRAEKRRRQEEAAAKRNNNNKKSSSSSAHAQDERYQHTAATTTTAPDAVSAAADLERVDFGRLTGLNKDAADGPYTAKANKSLANLSKTKNLQKMLADAVAKREKLEQLKRSHDENDKARAAAIQWSDALKEADGQRVKDDPTKLKKALARKAAKKASSQKAWKARMEQTAAAQQEKQQIRQHNLQARKQGGATGANLSKKRIASADDDDDDKDGNKGKKKSTGAASAQASQGGDKGRRLRPGFEGRRREFLNKKSGPPKK